MKKRIYMMIVLILAAGVMAGYIPDTGVSAESPIYDTASFQTVGSIVTFGRFEQDNNRVNGPDPIEWIVLDVQNGKALLLSRYALDTKPYNGNNDYISSDQCWEKSTLRAWLNQNFLNEAFNEKEKSIILTTHIDNSDAQSFEKKGQNDTDDRIFLLSYHEAMDLYFPGNEARICLPTNYAIANGSSTSYSNKVNGHPVAEWWLRTLYGGFIDTNYASYICSDGSHYSGLGLSTRYSMAVRPALWISLGQ